MRRLTARELHARKVAELGLDPALFDLRSVEAISAALRRLAWFSGPSTGATLVRGVMRPLVGLSDDREAFRGLVEETLEAVIGYGDLLEHGELGGPGGNGSPPLLHIAPASFVERESGSALLLGEATGLTWTLPPALQARVEYVRHVRRLAVAEGERVGPELRDLGLLELPSELWLRAPSSESSARHLARLDRLLGVERPSRDVPGLLVLDPVRPVGFYPRRWTDPGGRSGRFVARRPQAYGADLWCYVELKNGASERLFDLPRHGSRWRGCDEAWRLQMAIDAERGRPQRFRVVPSSQGAQILELFSPVPMWAQRRWCSVGEPVSRSGCLFAYRLPVAEVREEVRFAREELWLSDR